MKRLQLVLSFAFATAAPICSASALAQAAPAIPSYPTEISLVDEGERGFVFRETTHNLRLYTYDGDSASSSACVGSCVDAWPPVFAPAGSKQIGRWTTITRPDGRQQWAYSGKPVYMRFHDSPDQPTGDGIEGKWHLLPYTKDP